jgi:alpha-amylase
MKVAYRVANHGNEKIRTRFGVEFNINLLAGDAPDRYYHIPGHPLEDRRLASVGELKGVSEINLVDEWVGMKVVLKTAKKCDLWRFPVETISLSECGFERIFQGSCLLCYWLLELEPEMPFEVTIELGVESLTPLHPPS